MRKRIAKSRNEEQQQQQNNNSNSTTTRADDFLLPPRVLAPATIQASMMIVLAMIVAMVYNYVEVHDNVDPNTNDLLRSICLEQETRCHPRVIPWKRSQKALAHVQPGETVIKIPRNLMILDLDALRDDFIREELLGKVQLPLTGAAYLAAHLARLRNNPSSVHSLLQKYLGILPTLEDFASYHPVLWNESHLQQQLGFTSAYDLVQNNRAILQKEYDLFTKASTNFASQVSRQQYYASRLAVLTRSFGTGKLQTNISIDGINEIDYYHRQYQVDLTQGCYAMVPVLDLYDHYASPNVGFVYNQDRDSFDITAIQAIPPGGVLWDSYGLRTDSDLFARYGFVNGDGSDYTQASLAHHQFNFFQNQNEPTSNEVFHRSQRAQILRYLQYDDGYDECVTEKKEDGVEEGNGRSSAWELKVLKYKYLLYRADVPKHWTVILSPRRKAVTPPHRDDHDNTTATTMTLPMVDRNQPVMFNGTTTQAFSTCRVISLMHSDYDGHAIDILKAGLYDLNHSLTPTSDALEYRTLLCIARMATLALRRMMMMQGGGKPVDDQQVQQLVQQVIQQSAYKSTEWVVGHVKLGELQTLEALKDLVNANLRSTFGNVDPDREPGFRMRRNPCPKESLDGLFQLLVATHNNNKD